MHVHRQMCTVDLKIDKAQGVVVSMLLVNHPVVGSDSSTSTRDNGHDAIVLLGQRLHVTMTDENHINAVLLIELIHLRNVKHFWVVSDDNVPLSCGIAQDILCHVKTFRVLPLEPIFTALCIINAPAEPSPSLADVVARINTCVVVVSVQEDELHGKVLVLHPLCPIWGWGPPGDGGVRTPGVEYNLIPGLAHRDSAEVVIAKYTKPRFSIHTRSTVDSINCRLEYVLGIISVGLI